jgi:predicted dienelactone hydrolase
MSKKIILTLSILIIVLLAVFIGLRSSSNKNRDSSVAQFDLPTYAKAGPYQVGMQNLSMQPANSLEITVWYPASIDPAEIQETINPYKVKLGKPFGSVTIASAFGFSIKDAGYDRSGAPYPLVILSPGFSIGSSAYAWLAEHLASYGFVVVSPDHLEHLDPEGQLWQSAITRPDDILSVFHYLDQQINPGGALEGMIDTEVAAVIGHSYGGYTALASAGARINTPYLESLCQSAIDEDHEAAWICKIILNHLGDMANLAGLESVPEGLWPASADPRVDAIITIAGDAFFFGQQGLAEIQIPVLAIGGTADQDSPFTWGPQPSYDDASSPRKALVALDGAEHMIFTGPCNEIPWYLGSFSGEFCSDATWDRTYGQALTKHFSTAFLLAELKQDDFAGKALSQDNVSFSDVGYNETGY